MFQIDRLKKLLFSKTVTSISNIRDKYIHSTQKQDAKDLFLKNPNAVDHRKIRQSDSLTEIHLFINDTEDSGKQIGSTVNRSIKSAMEENHCFY